LTYVPLISAMIINYHHFEYWKDKIKLTEKGNILINASIYNKIQPIKSLKLITISL